MEKKLDYVFNSYLIATLSRGIKGYKCEAYTSPL